MEKIHERRREREGRDCREEREGEKRKRKGENEREEKMTTKRES